MEFTPPYIYIGLYQEEREQEEEATFLDSIKFVVDIERARTLVEEWQRRRADEVAEV